MVVAYHKVNQYGQSVATLGKVDPLLSLWGPFALFAALIGWLFLGERLTPRRAIACAIVALGAISLGYRA